MSPNQIEKKKWKKAKHLQNPLKEGSSFFLKSRFLSKRLLNGETILNGSYQGINVQSKIKLSHSTQYLLCTIWHQQYIWILKFKKSKYSWRHDNISMLKSRLGHALLHIMKRYSSCRRQKPPKWSSPPISTCQCVEQWLWYWNKTNVTSKLTMKITNNVLSEHRDSNNQLQNPLYKWNRLWSTNNCWIDFNIIQ